jgi:hypothetical protein
MAKDTRPPQWKVWPEAPSVMGFCFRSICIRVGVCQVVLCFFVLHLMSLEPIPPLSTDCPEVIELVNHSATLLVRFKSSYLILSLC